MPDQPKIILIGRDFEPDSWTDALAGLLQTYFRDRKPMAVSVERRLQSGIVFISDLPVGEG